jgi:heme-degrading monooxygenase HmoA
MLWARAGDGTSIFLILREFEVKPGGEERFESVYGPSGAGTRLFRRDPGYQSTLLLLDPSRPRIYLSLDLWHSESAFESFYKANLNAYQAIDGSTEQWLSRDISRFLQSG